MPTVNLTDRFITGASAPTGRVNFFDTKVRGLTLRVSPASKVWMFVYRTAGQPPQWLRLGDTDGLSLAEARQLAGRHRHAIDVEGRDPASEQRAAKAAPAEPEPTVMTVERFATVYLTVAKGKKATWQEDAQKIAHHIVPAWGSRPLASITRRDVHDLLDTLVAKGLTTGVNRVQALVSRMFTVAVDRSLVDAHPVARMEKRFSEAPRDRTLSDDEIRALVAGLDAQPGRAADAVMLRLRLGQRGKQIVSMRWADLDLDAALWRVPRGDMKNRRPHVLPLPTTAVALLKRRRAALPADEPQVFPHLTLLSDDYRALATIHGGAYEWKDLRRTMSTRLGDLGIDTVTIGHVLSHAKAGVTARHYALSDYLPEKRAALEAWDRELTRIIANEPTKAATVVALASKRRR